MGLKSGWICNCKDTCVKFSILVAYRRKNIFLCIQKSIQKWSIEAIIFIFHEAELLWVHCQQRNELIWDVIIWFLQVANVVAILFRLILTFYFKCIYSPGSKNLYCFLLMLSNFQVRPLKRWPQRALNVLLLLLGKSLILSLLCIRFTS